MSVNWPHSSMSVRECLTALLQCIWAGARDFLKNPHLYKVCPCKQPCETELIQEAKNPCRTGFSGDVDLKITSTVLASKEEGRGLIIGLPVDTQKMC